MRLVDVGNIMAVMDEEEIKKIYGGDIDKLKEVKAWAVQGMPSINNESDFWPVVDGKVLEWSYPYDNVTVITRLLNDFGREYSFFVADSEMPLLVKILKTGIESRQKYFVIAPRIEKINQGIEEQCP